MTSQGDVEPSAIVVKLSPRQAIVRVGPPLNCALEQRGRLLHYQSLARPPQAEVPLDAGTVPLAMIQALIPLSVRAVG